MEIFMIEDYTETLYENYIIFCLKVLFLMLSFLDQKKCLFQPTDGYVAQVN